MHAPLVGEGSVPNVRGAGIGLDVGPLVDIVRQLPQLSELLRLFETEFQNQVRKDTDQIGVPAALPVAVHRALNVTGPRPDCAQGVRYGEVTVVMGVDSDGDGVLRHRASYPLRNEVGERPAVRIAEDNAVRTSVDRSRQRSLSVGGIGPPAVEVVLGVEDDLLALLLEKSHRSADHLEILVQCGPERLRDVERPRLPKDRHHGRLSLQQSLDVSVHLGHGALPAGRPKGGKSGPDQRDLLHGLEEDLVLRIRPGPTPLDVVDPEGIETLGDSDLVLAGERESLALGAVPQGGVVDLDHTSTSQRCVLRGYRSLGSHLSGDSPRPRVC